MTPSTLARSMQVCGPVADPDAAERVRRALPHSDLVDQAWPALAPIFAASPYLARLARRRPTALTAALASDPHARFAHLLETTEALSRGDDPAGLDRDLRHLKDEAHLLIALADLGRVWDLEAVTAAMSDFADAALRAALAFAARAAVRQGRMRAPMGPEGGPAPGLFVVAMGKHGARELNYSSDIDISFFFDPERLAAASGVEPLDLAVRLAQRVASRLGEATEDGYVFRTDLRLRPDPAATPIAVPTAAALDYYETVGQNWERAAFIKARVAAGDVAAGKAFLQALRPFVWRRNLDYAAIADVHAIKRQILAGGADRPIRAAGADLKLGRGGIREIEFYVQTQQLILGGRDRSLRSPRTLEALDALAEAGHVDAGVAERLSQAYRRLRGLEHRVQMLRDEQTHRLPEDPADRRCVAALAGFDDLRRFDKAVARTLGGVEGAYAGLFAEEEPLSSRFGSLVFTGVEDDPETLQTLTRMGFSDPAQVSGRVRAWHHGRIRATRTPRGRELFTRLAPRLLEASRRTGAPDTAFSRFAEFFAGLNAGVQVQALFLAQPALFASLVEALAFAPELARTLSRHPGALDALLDRGFAAPLDAEGFEWAASTADEPGDGGLEAAMDAARRAVRERTFGVGLRLLAGETNADAAGRAYTELADACIRALAPAALAEVEARAGVAPGAVAVVALGKAGSREMTARSDLDLMTLHAAEPGAVSSLKGWSAETYFGRFTQRLIAALAAPTAHGALYPVDMQLRPSGGAGPVAVSLAAFQTYHAREAETWEAMALTRARVVWASAADFGETATAAIEAALRRARDRDETARNVLRMRALMARERPAHGFWDLKLAPGGLIDVEFVAQHLQLVHAASGGPLRPNTLDALDALAEAGLAARSLLDDLAEAWRLQQSLSQLIRAALGDAVDPTGEPPPFRRKLARAGQARSFVALEARLRRVRTAACRASAAVLGPTERHSTRVQSGKGP